MKWRDFIGEIPTKDEAKRSRQSDPSDSDTGLTSVKEKEERRPPPPKAPWPSSPSNLGLGV